MRMILLFSFLFFTLVIKNIVDYGYGLNDAFWRVVWSIDEGTIWAQNFSEKNFSKIKLGNSSDEVLALMGQPLFISEHCDNGCFWHYTKQDSGTSDFDQRWIVFDKTNKVVEVRKSFFID